MRGELALVLGDYAEARESSSGLRDLGTPADSIVLGLAEATEGLGRVDDALTILDPQLPLTEAIRCIGRFERRRWLESSASTRRSARSYQGSEPATAELVRRSRGRPLRSRAMIPRPPKRCWIGQPSRIPTMRVSSARAASCSLGPTD